MIVAVVVVVVVAAAAAAAAATIMMIRIPSILSKRTVLTGTVNVILKVMIVNIILVQIQQ